MLSRLVASSPLAVVPVRHWSKNAALRRLRPPNDMKYPPVMTAQEMAKHKPAVGESFFEPVIKPEFPINKIEKVCCATIFF